MNRSESRPVVGDDLGPRSLIDPHMGGTRDDAELREHGHDTDADLDAPLGDEDDSLTLADLDLENGPTNRQQQPLSFEAQLLGPEYDQLGVLFGHLVDMTNAPTGQFELVPWWKLQLLKAAGGKLAKDPTAAIRQARKKDRERVG